MPLRSRDDAGLLRPTQLELEDEGNRREPVNAPFELRLSERTPGQLTVGPTAAQAVTVRPLGAAATPLQTPGERLFWPETHEATDTMVIPTVSGAETFEQLRDASAPDRFRYAVELPEGARLELTAGGGAQVVQDGVTTVRVTPPVAHDAAGRTVDVRLELEPGGLALVVDHRRAGVTYPVLADPQWVSTYDFALGSGFEGWGSRFIPDPSWYHAFGTTAPGGAGHPEASGLWIIPTGNRTYSFIPPNAGPHAKAVFIAPGNGTLASVRYEHFRYNHYKDPDTGDGDGQGARLAVYGGPGPGWLWGIDFVGESDETSDATVSSGPLPAGAKTAEFWLFTSGCGDGNTCHWSVPASNKASWAQVGAVEMVIEDPEAPSVGISGPLASLSGSWLNAGSGRLDYTLSAADPTSGLIEVRSQSWMRARPGGYLDEAGVQQPSCDAGHHTPGRQGAICQQGLDQALHVDVASLPGPWAGYLSFRPYAADLAGSESYGAAHTVWIDRYAPSVSFSGELWAARDTWLNDPFGHELRATATDTTVAGESGVDRQQVTARHQADAGQPLSAPATQDDYDACPAPNPVAAPPADWQPCPTTGATRVLGGIDLPEGRNRFEAAIGDYAGNQGSRPAFDVYVDATRPTLQLTGSLAELEDTWGDPEGTLELGMHTGDALSGVAAYGARVLDGQGREHADLADRTACPSPDDPGLTPCPRSPAVTEVTVPAADLPEGLVEIEAEVSDHAGNARSRRFAMHVDRTPPTVELTGEITTLDDGWQATGEPVDAIVSAGDELSGIRAVELWVRDAAGRETRLDREVTCDEAATYTGDGAPCPLDVMTVFEVDASRLPDGRNTFFARAVEFTGKPARDQVTLELDNTGPAAPTSLQIAERGEDTASLSWSPGPEPPADVGLAHYVITVVVDGVTVRENISPYPYATIGGLPKGITVKFLVRAIDRLERESPRTSGTLARLASVGGSSDLRDAMKLRPLIYFDSREAWRPRGVSDLFAESFRGRYQYRDPERHEVCAPKRIVGDSCLPLYTVNGLQRRPDSDHYIDIHGSSRDGVDYEDPDLSSCRTWAFKDCGSDVNSAIYYNVTRRARHLYADYWWFYRYNDSQRGPDFPQCRGIKIPIVLEDTCFDHEGDWEGVTVVTAPGDTDRLQYVSYSSHGHWFKYPMSVVGVWKGTRPRVYPANGTHANYPRKCFNGCGQTDSKVPETQFDGRRAWDRNLDKECGTTCLRALPEVNRDPDALPRPTDWNAWQGRWGKKESKLHKHLAEGPRSPGRQPHHNEPWEFQATNRRDFASLASAGRALTAAVDEEARAEADCDAWFGPVVAVSSCDGEAIAEALGRNAFDRPGAVQVSTGRLDAGTAPGLTQLLSDPLAPGTKVELEGDPAASTELRVRGATDDGAAVARFDAVDSPGTLTYRLAGDEPRFRFVTEDGRTLAPDAVERDLTAVASARAPRPAAPRRLRARIRSGYVTVRFRAGGRRTRIELLRRSGEGAISRRTVFAARGRTREIRMRARDGRLVRAWTVGNSGRRSASRWVTIRR